MSTNPTDNSKIIFETTSGEADGVADVEDIAIAAAHLALDLAAHSNDPEKALDILFAHEELNGPAAALITKHALYWLTTNLFDQVLKGAKGYERIMRPELLKQAIDYGRRRSKPNTND